MGLRATIAGIREWGQRKAERDKPRTEKHLRERLPHGMSYSSRMDKVESKLKPLDTKKHYPRKKIVRRPGETNREAFERHIREELNDRRRASAMKE
jgi:hypothetical protein